MQGAKTCAQWLSYRIGLGVNAAREKVRVARRLGELPLIDAAMRQGELSFSKVRAMTRVATPENEEQLLRTARHATGAQLERICRGHRQVTDGRKPHVDDERRYVRRRYTPSGMVRIEAQLRPDEAALVMQALGEMRSAVRDGRNDEQADETVDGACDGTPVAVTKSLRKDVTAETTPDPQPDKTAEPATEPSVANTKSLRKNVTAETKPDPTDDAPTPNLADGLVLMAESTLARGPATRRAGERNQLIVQLGEELLEGGDRSPWRAELHDGTWLSGETFHRFACDCSVTVVKTAADGTPLDVGRKRRTIPPALWTALLSRDRGTCRFPGCTSRTFLAAHHIEPWSQGGHTKLENLILVCGGHHERLHEGGFRVDRHPDGTFHFFTPEGEPIEPCPSPPALEGDGLAVVMAHSDAAGLPIDHRTTLPVNYAPRFDLVDVVSSLLPNRGRL